MKKISIEIKWALIFVGMMLLWMWLEKLVGLHDIHIDKHAYYTNIVAIPAIMIYVLALLDKRKNFYGGTMTYLQGLISGLIITMIITIITPLSQIITAVIITPDYFSNVIEYAVSSGMMDRATAEESFNLNSYMMQATIGAFFMGVVTSIIVALFSMKKNVTNS